MFNRREFLGSASLAVVGNPLAASLAPPKVAFLGTAFYKHSHAQHFLDRLTQGYTWGGQWVKPRVSVASVYVDQFPINDVARGRVQKHNLNLVNTIEDALTLGTGKLAVDGVVIIGEHGNYPKNEMGQYLYPRYAWFKKIVKIFEASGRSVPVFNDKHLSTSWAECVEMVADSKRLRFPFLAGSSLPVTWRLPELELPMNIPLKESVCVAYGGTDSYDFHALETTQCMSERRKGGETGIRSVWALKGKSLWRELAKPERSTTARLVVAALNTSHNLPAVEGYPTAPVDLLWAAEALPEVTGYLIEHNDGFRTTTLLTGIADFNYAGITTEGKIFNCQMMLPMPNRNATTADFFNPLVRHIENMVLSNQLPYPVERTLLTSGMVIGGMKSLFQGQKKVLTPEMATTYQAQAESAFRK